MLSIVRSRLAKKNIHTTNSWHVVIVVVVVNRFLWAKLEKTRPKAKYVLPSSTPRIANRGKLAKRIHTNNSGKFSFKRGKHQQKLYT